MKALAEVQRLRLAEEAIKSLDPERLTIRVLGRRAAHDTFSGSLSYALRSDMSIMALYNPESGEIFYLEQGKKEPSGMLYIRDLSTQDLHALLPPTTTENMPLVLHEDLVEGQYPTTWDAVKAKGGPTP
ncbi:hypothetical protein TWF703_005157 [Orbilia oligospora]|uniref:Uncharacterized protein n=1 Tax=Orbilia oligospora TaxID=2813651 RepID=A0A7C8NWF7_ORBOL|nr:hypothetical protein TWF703_005157 [Orbilia oligospora]